MAKKVGKIAARYSKAFLRAVEKELGIEGPPTPAQEIAATLKEFVGIWKSDRQLSLFVLSPMFDTESRGRALVEVAKIAGLKDISVRFLTVLFERGRMIALPEIALEFAELAEAAAGVVQVELVTARDIDSVEKVEVEQLLSSYVDGKPNFHWHIDKHLLGGMIVRYGGKIMDGSVNGRIERIEQELVP